MNAYLSQIEAAASRMVAAANKAITAKAKIHSPSRVTAGYGKDYVAGFVKAIKRTQRPPPRQHEAWHRQRLQP